MFAYRQCPFFAANRARPITQPKSSPHVEVHQLQPISSSKPAAKGWAYKHTHIQRLFPEREHPNHKDMYVPSEPKKRKEPH